MKANNIKLFSALILAAAASACGGASGTTKTEKIEGVEWNVAVHKVVDFNDSIRNISTQQDYTVADTATVNAALRKIRRCENICISWTLPISDGSIWLIAYDKKPLISEMVKVTEAHAIQSYGDDIQVAFKFPDATKWAAITRENIGRRLAVIVDGQVMNAPQVNTEITSGNCSVTIPADMVRQFLPEIDLEKLRR